MPAPPTTPWLQLWGLPQLVPASDAPAQPFAPERRFQLLVLLALQPGQWVERDRIAALLWPGHALADARRNLRKVVHRAHAVAGTQGLEATEHALRWHIATDLQAFEAALRAGAAAQALAWRSAPPLEGLDDPDNATLAELLSAERTRIEQAWLAAALADVEAQATPAARAAAARRVLAVDALDEPAMRALLHAELQQGRAVEAQAAYRRYAARLAEELGVEPARALRDLVQVGVAGAAVDAGPALAAAAATAASGTASPLAAEATADGFIGRRLELAEAHALLARTEARCLTLLGPGGMGKSRLAQQLMPRCAAGFPGGMRWVELQDTATLPAALARLAQALGATLHDTGDPVEQLLRQLPRERSLLVLDNAEQLPVLTPALQRLLEGAPALVLLVTSRARLHLPGEEVLPLAGLAVPDEDSRDLEAAASFDAVRLFERHAALARRDFSLGAHLAAVIQIVEAVAGMPLAIELAAAWVRLLPPEQVAQDLQGGIDLLERDPALQGRPARPEHTSLRAVLDGSWQLLAPRERVALAALSVFQGGFTRAAALAVAGCSLPLLSSLVDKSLVAVDETGRFALHAVVAAFAAERHAEDPARAAGEHMRHAEFYARHLAALAAHARTDPRPLIDGVDAEFANDRAAWQHAVDTGRADLVRAMTPTWTAFHDHRGRLDEGISSLRLALALPDQGVASQQALSVVRHGLSSLLHRKGDLQESLAIAENALDMAERCGERAALKGCLGNIGLCLWNAGRAAESLPPLQRALALSETDGDRATMAAAMAQIGIAEKALGRYDRALQLQSRALAIQRELGDQQGIASRLNNIGNLHRARHDWPEARRHFEEGLGLCRHYGLVQPAMLLRLNLGLTLFELGVLDDAREHLETVLVELRVAAQVKLELAVELGLARIHVAQHDAASALERLNRVVGLAQAKAFNTHPVVAASIYAELLAERGDVQGATRIWLMASAQEACDQADRQGALTLIERLDLSADQLALARRSVPTLDEVLAAMRAPAAAAEAGNAKETPPA